jgi:hypothetical protein
VRSTLAQIKEAFADAPRPSNEDLLPDELVESEYAALSFLSPDGFRHFIPAYMSFTLRHLESGAAAVDSTIWSLAPVFYEDAGLKDFVVSKLASLTDSQRAAVVAFLEAVRELGDEYLADQATQALSYWA